MSVSLLPKTKLAEMQQDCNRALANKAYTLGVVSLDAQTVLQVISELKFRRFKMSQNRGK